MNKLEDSFLEIYLTETGSYRTKEEEKLIFVDKLIRTFTIVISRRASKKDFQDALRAKAEYFGINLPEKPAYMRANDTYNFGTNEAIGVTLISLI